MSRTRLRATDYNAEGGGRLKRTTKWWFAPEHVTSKSKKFWGMGLGLGVAALAAMLLVSLFRPDPTFQEVVAAPPPGVTEGVKPACLEQPAAEVPPEILIETAYETQWVRDGDMLRPTSAAAGPGMEKPFPACFSRNPEGALYSAASFASGVLSAIPAGNEKEFFQARASHTDNYAVLMADLPDAGPVQNRPTVKFSGYRWNGYTPDLTSVELRYTLVTGPRAGSTTSLTYTMTWENNDWLLVVPGKTDTVASATDSTRTFIPWGGTA